MAIQTNDNFSTNAPKPTDDRYFNNLSPWASIAEANAWIPSSKRYRWLTININWEEFWYKDWIADVNLIQKIAWWSSTKFDQWSWSPIWVLLPEWPGHRYLDTNWPTIWTAYWMTDQDWIS